MIEAKGLSKSFADKVVLSNIDFRIAKGNIFGVMGRNGAGKTTLIKALLREVTYSGEVALAEELLIKENVNPRQVYYVSDTPHTYGYLSGLEFIQFALRIKGREVPSQERIFQVLYFFGIAKEDALKLLKDYSFGMRRKVVLTVGFLMKPALMILDEPTIGLDTPSVIILKKLILAAAKKEITFFVTSHDPVLMAELCDSLLVLHDSRPVYYNQDFALESRDLSELYMDLIGEDIEEKVKNILDL